MKRTVSLVALLLVALPAVVLAYPGIGGGRGLLRVQNALVEDEAGLTISAHGLGRNPKFPVETDLVTKGWVLDLVAPELSYAPLVTKYVALELFGSWGGVFQTPKSAEGGGFTMSTHDLKAGGKLSVPIVPVLKLGFAGNYTFTSGRDDDRAGTTWLDQYALPQAGIGDNSPFAWTALATLQLQDVLPTAPNVMFNYGKINDETRYGLGVELAGRGFALFGEVLSRQVAGSSGIFDTETGNIYLTPGVVFGNASAVSFKAAYSFALGEKANNELIAGFSLATPFGARAKPEYGTITGRVTDEKTGAALTANVQFPDDDKMPSFTTDATGVFEVSKVLAGVTVVKVGAPGYQAQSVPLDISKDAVTMHEFKLRPLVTYGVIAGGVIDAKTRKPLAARIEVPGTGVAAVNDDPATGTFKVENVPVGVYTVTASSDGYYPGSQTVAVEEGKVASARFELVSTAVKKSALSGKVSDKGTGKALAATVSFPDAGLASVATDPATGVYMTEIAPGSYAIKAAAEGYIDQTAAIIIEEGKPQIRNFELVKEGMSITLRGVYFDFDKSTIKPESHAALADAAKILTDNPTIRVEIQGHTDSRGSDSYNLDLSDRRSWSVVNYLVQNFGIDKARLTARGYGEARPIDTNDTDAGRSMNRRVEFVILGK